MAKGRSPFRESAATAAPTALRIAPAFARKFAFASALTFTSTFTSAAAFIPAAIASMITHLFIPLFRMDNTLYASLSDSVPSWGHKKKTGPIQPYNQAGREGDGVTRRYTALLR